MMVVEIVCMANTLQLLAWPISLVAFHANLAGIPPNVLVLTLRYVNHAHRDICNLSQDKQRANLFPVEPS